MKKLFSTSLIFLFFLGAALNANAQTISADSMKTIIANQLKEDMKEYKLAEVEVNISNLPLSTFELPDGKVSVSVTSNSKNLNPREYKKIEIMVNKKLVRTIYAATEIKAYKDVLVAKQTIARDKAVTGYNVEMKRVDIIKNLNDTLSYEDLNRGIMAKKTFFAGEMITKKYTAARPDVIRNAMVSVNFQTDNNLTIMVEGIALNQGNVGDTIQVKNKRLNRIYTGTIVGENKVLIQI